MTDRTATFVLLTAWLLPGECLCEGCPFLWSRHQHKRPARPGDAGAGVNPRLRDLSVPSGTMPRNGGPEE